MVESIDNGDSGLSIAEGEWHGESTRFVARRVIVKLKASPEESPAALASMARDLESSVPDGHLLRPPSRTQRVVLEVAADADVTAVAGELADRDDIEYAEPDLVDRAAIVPNDPHVGDQWALPIVQAFDAWDLETGSPDVVIGVIDSGISMSAGTGGTLDHEDLDDTTRIVVGTDYVDGGNPRDTNGHGTHVAGVAGAAGNNGIGIAGMSWGSRLYICRTLDANGNGSTADFADAVEEIVDYAVANGLKAVINYSAGGGDNQTRRDACQYANDNGMLVVAATGNDNAGPVLFPAAYSTTMDGVIGVGSTDDDDTVSSFSNVGPEVTVVAPGRSILSTMPTYPVTSPAGIDYGTMTGTSMATPLVSGLAALVWSRHPSLTNAKVKDCLESTAVPLGDGDFDESWGHGRVDALAALRCGDITIPPTVIDPRCPPPVSLVPAQCPSRIVVTCPSVSPASCPSQLPVLCPSSRVPQQCPSRLPVLCPTTAVPARCPQPITVAPARCPQPITVAPARCPQPITVAPARCPLPPPTRITCQPGPQLPTPRDPRASGDSEQWYDESGDYLWIDDAGQVHPWSAAAGEAAANKQGADYYWVDEAGGIHYWSPGDDR